MTPKKRINKIPVKIRSGSFADPLSYRIVSDEMINLSKAQAFDFLEMETFIGERPVSETHVQFLFDEWAGGRFLWHHVLLASAELEGKVYRINGQHTCWMRVNIPDDKPVKAECRKVCYRVDTEEQLRTIYSTFDRNKARTVGHISRVLLTDTSAGRDLPGHIISKVVGGFKVFWSEDWKHLSRDGMNTNEIIGLIQKRYDSLFNVVGHFIKMHYPDHVFVRRAAVIAAMFSTSEKSVAASVEFWTPVCDWINLTEKGDPRYQLRQMLTNHTVVMTGGIGTEDMYRMCINAWNKWRKKESIAVLRTTDKRMKPL